MTEPAYRFLAPPAALAEVFAGIWSLQTLGSGEAETIAPDGCCEIILHRTASPLEQTGSGWTRQPPAFLYGPMCRALVLRQKGEMDVTGLRLHPWAAGALGPVPGQWRNRAVPLADILGAASQTLLDVARSCAALEAFSDAAAAILEPCLTIPPVQADVREHIEALAGGEARSIDDLAARAGTSSRTIGRRFERACGLTAGEVIRIQRFGRARAAIKAGAALSDAAADAGYADQAHMTRDFRRLAGATPRPVRDPAVFDVFYAASGE